MVKMYSERIKKIHELAKKENLDAVFLSGIDCTIPNIYYFTGFLDVFPSSFVVSDKSEWLLTFSPRKARIKTKIKQIVDLNNTKISEFLKKRGLDCGRIGIDGKEQYSFFEALKKQLPELTLVDVSPQINSIRCVKDAFELQKIRTACLLTDSVMEDVVSETIVGKNELQVANIIKKAMLDKGKDWAFDTIVAGDVNSSFVHHVPEKVKFRSIALLDFGVKHEYYCADMTRMILLERKKEHICALDALKDVHALLEDYVKPGVPACNIHNFAKNRLIDLGFRETNFGEFHALGHSVGLEAHDGFGLSPKNTQPVLENMVLTLEPAIYFPGKFGVRLEDTIVVTKTGIRRLTKSPFDF